MTHTSSTSTLPEKVRDSLLSSTTATFSLPLISDNHCPGGVPVDDQFSDGSQGGWGELIELKLIDMTAVQ